MKSLVLWAVALVGTSVGSFTMLRHFMCPEHALAATGVLAIAVLANGIPKFNGEQITTALTVLVALCAVESSWAAHSAFPLVLMLLLATIDAILASIAVVGATVGHTGTLLALLAEALLVFVGISWLT